MYLHTISSLQEMLLLYHYSILPLPVAKMAATDIKTKVFKGLLRSLLISVTITLANNSCKTKLHFVIYLVYLVCL